MGEIAKERSEKLKEDKDAFIKRILAKKETYTIKEREERKLTPAAVSKIQSDRF
jgi:hypothetical protein